MDRSDDDPTGDVPTIEPPTLVPATRPHLVIAPTGSHERASRPSLPGYQLGPAIGVGGMGEVLLAHDAELREIGDARATAAARHARRLALPCLISTRGFEVRDRRFLRGLLFLEVAMREDLA